jgi:FAD/FMN-containing dehydrogenase
MHSSTARIVSLFCLFTFVALPLGCQGTPIRNNPDAHVPLQSRPEWRNWSQNLKHKPARGGGFYYFSPTNREELRTIVAQAARLGIELRVSGQRHSQPPLVVNDNREEVPYQPKTWLVDLSCYSDIGQGGLHQVHLNRDNDTVTVNAGVREDYLDAYLTQHDYMLKTVTAGGFFSLGGMTAVDVHGATIKEPIFAETVSGFTIMGPDGEVTKIDLDSSADNGWKPIQFARVSMGALGIVTSVTLDVLKRPWATTIKSGSEDFIATDEDAFVKKYKKLLKHDRLESFWSPYSKRFVVLWWDIKKSPKHEKENKRKNVVASSCTYAEVAARGAPYEHKNLEWLAQKSESWVQFHKDRTLAQGAINVAFFEVKKLFKAATKQHSDLWLTEAARVAFMSYFVEMPQTDDAGLRRVWKSLQVVAKTLKKSDHFLIAAPLEFRFIKGGDSALAATYSSKPDTTFVNLDLISFVPKKAAADYPKHMLRFFADVERQWYGKFDGEPHGGKMYGFHDPKAESVTATAPFSPAFMSDLAMRRSARLEAFETYRKRRDPDGLFCNDFLRSASICPPSGED